MIEQIRQPLSKLRIIFDKRYANVHGRAVRRIVSGAKDILQLFFRHRLLFAMRGEAG